MQLSENLHNKVAQLIGIRVSQLNELLLGRAGDYSQGVQLRSVAR